MEIDERQLLAAWTEHRDARAFENLVRQYVDLVYAAARRQLQNAAAAEDVSQAVFLVLARKAHRLSPRQSLGPWLLVVTRYACRETRREERRRRTRETLAVTHIRRDASMETPTQNREFSDARALLDEHLARLGTLDRTALVLRYLEERPVDEVAARMGVNEAAAKKRIARAIERLRALFLRTGVTLAAPDLQKFMARIPAPHHLADSVLFAVHAKTAIHSGLIAKGTMKMMFVTQAKMAAMLVAGALIVTSTGALVAQKTLASDSAPPLRALAPATAPAQPSISVKGYDLWSKFPVGTAVTMVSQIAQPGRDQTLQPQAVFTLVANAPGKIRVSMKLEGAVGDANGAQIQGDAAMLTDYNPDGHMTSNGTMLSLADLSRAREIGTEVVEAAGKKYDCHVLESSTQFGQTQVLTKTWISSDMPGGVVKVETKESGKQNRTITTLVTAIKLGDTIP
jgi:RNA polymerase sigma factor (sigma-70 family)